MSGEFTPADITANAGRSAYSRRPAPPLGGWSPFLPQAAKPGKPNIFPQLNNVRLSPGKISTKLLPTRFNN